MSLRISTAQLYSAGVGGIQQLQSSLYTLQNQIDTGRRIVTPKDDPVGAAQALVVTQSKSVNELYIKNQASADTKLSALDSTLLASTKNCRISTKNLSPRVTAVIRRASVPQLRQSWNSA